jgi:F-type H+-transporting ATPase subunit b
MESILHTFGIDWRLLLVNAVNFGLLLAGLTYFLYKPILAMLEERRKKVAEGVEAARVAQEKLSRIELDRQEALKSAGREADEIIAAARASGAQKGAALVEASERRAQAALAEAAKEAEELKAKALAEAKGEVAELIVLGMQKIK